MLRDINRARRSIDIEHYIYSSDEVGDRFTAALIAAKKRGVQIRILCDGVGSNGPVGDLREEDLLSHGIEVVFFNEQKLWKLWRLIWFWKTILRDHSKLLVVDGQVSYTGGLGIRADMKSWRDTNVRLKGHVVAAMQKTFNKMWERAAAGKIVFGFWPFTEPDTSFQYVMNFPKPDQRFIYYEFLRAIKKAKKYVYLTTPYFVPPPQFSRAIKAAVRRGVDVRLLVPHASNHPIVDLASQSYYWVALRSGMRIYRYKEQMLHDKTAVIDDEWASVGSANLDNLSFLLNYEGNIFSTNNAFVSAIKKDFLEDLTKSQELTAEQWQRRPFTRKLLELLTWPVHSIL